MSDERDVEFRLGFTTNPRSAQQLADLAAGIERTQAGVTGTIDKGASAAIKRLAEVEVSIAKVNAMGRKSPAGPRSSTRSTDRPSASPPRSEAFERLESLRQADAESAKTYTSTLAGLSSSRIAELDKEASSAAKAFGRLRDARDAVMGGGGDLASIKLDVDTSAVAAARKKLDALGEVSPARLTVETDGLDDAGRRLKALVDLPPARLSVDASEAESAKRAMAQLDTAMKLKTVGIDVDTSAIDSAAKQMNNLAKTTTGAHAAMAKASSTRSEKERAAIESVAGSIDSAEKRRADAIGKTADAAVKRIAMTERMTNAFNKAKESEARSTAQATAEQEKAYKDLGANVTAGLSGAKSAIEALRGSGYASAEAIDLATTALDGLASAAGPAIENFGTIKEVAGTIKGVTSQFMAARNAKALDVTASNQAAMASAKVEMALKSEAAQARLTGAAHDSMNRGRSAPPSMPRGGGGGSMGGGRSRRSGRGRGIGGAVAGTLAMGSGSPLAMEAVNLASELKGTAAAAKVQAAASKTVS